MGVLKSGEDQDQQRWQRLCPIRSIESSCSEETAMEGGPSMMATSAMMMPEGLDSSSRLDSSQRADAEGGQVWANRVRIAEQIGYGNRPQPTVAPCFITGATLPTGPATANTGTVPCSCYEDGFTTNFLQCDIRDTRGFQLLLVRSVPTSASY